jgi:hypothetical protein
MIKHFANSNDIFPMNDEFCYANNIWLYIKFGIFKYFLYVVLKKNSTDQH